MAIALRTASGSAREASSKRKPVNVSLPQDQLAAAKELGLNVSQACSEGLAAAIKRELERRWLAENADAIRSHNEWVEKNGLPLARHRLF